MREVFVAAERGVIQRGPVHTEMDKGTHGSNWPTHDATLGAGLGIASVVRHEEDERVVQHSTFLKARYQVADAFIHTENDGGIEGH
jgi:hypothetical protein